MVTAIFVLVALVIPVLFIAPRLLGVAAPTSGKVVPSDTFARHGWTVVSPPADRLLVLVREGKVQVLGSAVQRSEPELIPLVALAGALADSG